MTPGRDVTIIFERELPSAPIECYRYQGSPQSLRLKFRFDSPIVECGKERTNGIAHHCQIPFPSSAEACNSCGLNSDGDCLFPRCHRFVAGSSSTEAGAGEKMVQSR